MTYLHTPIPQEQIRQLFEAQKVNQYEVANTSVAQRRKKLKALSHAVAVTYRKEINEALFADLGKPITESDAVEVQGVVSEIKYAISNLSDWMGKHPVKTPIALLGSRSWIKYEPKGVCLVISPWNYPLLLTLGPLISAVASGNTVILKPSEFTPNTTQVLKKIVSDLFPVNEVALVEGGVEASTALLEMPFNHIFFTGSPAVGKIVMGAAAKHLSSVTLELGGKSPTIIDETANITLAAERIVTGKFINCGQTCLAPDHVYVHESKYASFVEDVKKAIKQSYTDQPESSTSYPRIVNQKHFDRLNGYIQEAIGQGAQLVFGGKTDREAKLITPTVMTNVPETSSLMQEEIFGPILPVFPYSDLNSLIAKINKGEKPLGLYIYSTSKKNIELISSQTRAGGTCINHNALHFLNHYLPFGGSNNSGIGKSHGFFGFEAFSNARAFYQQLTKGPADLLAPPYTNLKQKLIDFTIKNL